MPRKIRPEIGTYFYTSCLLCQGTLIVSTLEGEFQIPAEWYAESRLVIASSSKHEMEVACSGTITIYAPSQEASSLIRQLEVANEMT